MQYAEFNTLMTSC